MTVLILGALAYSTGIMSAQSEAGAQYANPQLIIEADELGKRKAGGQTIVDVRKASDYEKGHIFKALHVDAAAWAMAFAATQDAAEWSKRLGDLSIDDTSTVIVYGDPKTPDAARIWWILRYWGVRDVRILNGGWPAWEHAGYKVSTEPTTVPSKSPELVPQ